MDKLKIILIFIGIAIIFGFLASFLQSRSPLDAFIITIGMIAVVFGFNSQSNGTVTVNETVNYFVAMFCVNLLQWFILIYIFFINRVYITFDFFYYLAGALLFTIFLIIRIRRKGPKYPGNSQKTNKDVIWADKVKVILIFAGIVIMLGCLASFLQSRSPLDVFGSSIGMMAIIYGFYREDKKVKVTVNYFVAMFYVNLLQWFILIFFRGPVYSDTISFAFTFTILFTLTFFIQVRESDLVYIGKMRKRDITQIKPLKESDIDETGYLICCECGGYYKLEPGESPDDFDKCHCGGELEHKNELI